MAAVSVLLLYPPLQFAPGAVPKPDGSLGIAYLAGALREAGIDVAVLDAAVGETGEAFDRREALPSGLTRVGLSDDAILAAAAPHAVVGVASTFTAQHPRAIAVVRLIRAACPDKLVLVGGVSARHFRAEFLAAGADAVFLSEAEREIVAVVQRFASGSRDFRDIPGLALPWGCTVTPAPLVDLDQLPMPAWDLLPNAAYWRIGRPHGGAFGKPIRYAEMMTSRGCAFACTYCHLSVETPDRPSGDIGRFRMKSADRVLREIDTLRALGVERVYVEDDSLLAKKARILAILGMIRDRGLALADVNGVNIAHLYRNDGGALVPDTGLLEALAACGFEDISLPFESASERILATYASRKWSPARMDTAALVRACVAAKLPVSGNYMIGFPDETEDEIAATLRMAREHMDAGLTDANVFLVVPFPGTVLFEEARDRGYLADDWSPDDMLWFKPVMRNTTVAPERLLEIRASAWRDLNRPEYVAARAEASL